MLPDHAGGMFETVTVGSRATARFLADPNRPFADQGSWGFWLQQVAWGTSKDLGDTAVLRRHRLGRFGRRRDRDRRRRQFRRSRSPISHGKDADGDNDNEVNADQYELAAYWRGSWGGFARLRPRLGGA